jgi:hypothetical protein
MANIGYDYAAFGCADGRWGNSFVSITALGSGDIDVRTVQQPLGTGERYSVQDFAIGLGYGEGHHGSLLGRWPDHVDAGDDLAQLGGRHPR